MSTFDSAPNFSWKMCYTSSFRISSQHVTYRDWEKVLPEAEFQQTSYHDEKIQNSRSFEDVLLIRRLKSLAEINGLGKLVCSRLA
jgi:hypothetical protein